jgi:hypothetical protein
MRHGPTATAGWLCQQDVALGFDLIGVDRCPLPAMLAEDQ